ncbi:MAG: hypothetical protein ABJO09_06565 [Hyphomicrobiales bacterium]|uniref:hypothetical protein n=1 Tax=Alphaproteobacteria TaxID=28211 RepID=UPI003264E94D
MSNKLFISVFALTAVMSSIASASPIEETSPVQQIFNDLLIVSEKKTSGDHTIRIAGDRQQNRRVEFIPG